LSVRSARRRNLGAATIRPSGNAAKHFSPRSILVSTSISGRTSGWMSNTNEAKYRPAASLITVTELGSVGSSRDQRTRSFPIFGRPSQARSLAFCASVTGCRLELVVVTELHMTIIEHVFDIGKITNE
jgi:hypothetical protein